LSNYLLFGLEGLLISHHLQLHPVQTRTIIKRAATRFIQFAKEDKLGHIEKTTITNERIVIPELAHDILFHLQIIENLDIFKNNSYFYSS